MLKIKILSACCLTILLVCACGVSRFSEQRLVISGDYNMPATIIIYAGKAPDWDLIYTTMNSYASRLDNGIEQSTLWLLNHAQQADLDPSVYQVLQKAVHIAEISSGAFDPTILPLVNRWNITDEQIDAANSAWQVPDPAAIKAAQLLVDYRRITFSAPAHVSLPVGFGIELGGISQGAIADQTADFLNTLGYTHFLIEVSGEILLSGLKPEGAKESQWTIVIRHPRQSGAYLARLLLGSANKRIAIVTSGDYERYIEMDGRRYHHILDPATGYPAQETVSVTVIADDCTTADALSTAAFVMGFTAGTALLEKLENTEGIVVRIHDNKPEAALTTGFPADLKDINLDGVASP